MVSLVDVHKTIIQLYDVKLNILSLIRPSYKQWRQDEEELRFLLLKIARMVKGVDNQIAGKVCIVPGWSITLL